MYYVFNICTCIIYDIFQVEQILKHGRLRILPISLFWWLHPQPNLCFVVEKTINNFISYFGFLVDQKEIWKIFDVKRWQNWYLKMGHILTTDWCVTVTVPLEEKKKMTINWLVCHRGWCVIWRRKPCSALLKR